MALLVVLAMSAWLVYAGRSESLTDPSVWNTRPSGTAAFAELLRSSGYTVTVDRSPRPKFRPDAILVAPCFQGECGPQELWGTGETGLNRDQESPLGRFLVQGGKALAVAFPRRLPSRTSHGKQTRELRSDRTRAELKVSWPGAGLDARDKHDGLRCPLWSASEDVWAWAVPVGQGVAVYVEDGTPFANRYLGRHDNASASLSLVRSLAVPGSKVVFWEGQIGNVDRPGLIGALGSWAVAAQWQLAILAVSVALTLGCQFGSAGPPPTPQRSARDLVDAFAETLRRSGKCGYALRLVALDVLSDCRAALRAAASVRPESILPSLPSPLSERLAEALAEPKGTPSELVSRAAELYRLALKFQGDTRARKAGRIGPE